MTRVESYMCDCCKSIFKTEEECINHESKHLVQFKMVSAVYEAESRVPHSIVLEAANTGEQFTYELPRKGENKIASGDKN